MQPNPVTQYSRAFDLNVGTVLDHWTVEFALREVIANALDEQTLTNTAAPSILIDSAGWWHIRDFGRGVQHVHLTQDESLEKRAHGSVIGQFGMGLKDALAFFDRGRFDVRIRSAHGVIRLERHRKSGFDDVVTLHAIVEPPEDEDMIGTDFAIRGVTASQMAAAKDMFLDYRDDEVIESTDVGQVVANVSGAPARIYVRGLLVAQEDNFLFSYNITKLNTALKRALNRERSNVGRSAYSERVKRILLDSRSGVIASRLAQDLSGYASGSIHDEVSWSEVAVHATRIMQASERVVFVSATELEEHSPQIDYAKDEGYTVVPVPSRIAEKLDRETDSTGRPMMNLRQYQQDWNQSFTYEFVSPSALTAQERDIWQMADGLFDLLRLRRPGQGGPVKELLISETMRAGSTTTEGVWEPTFGRVIIQRRQLANGAAFAATVLHELCHVRSGASDLSLQFENALSVALGELAQKLVPV